MSKIQVHCHGLVIFLFVAVNKIYVSFQECYWSYDKKKGWVKFPICHSWHRHSWGKIPSLLLILASIAHSCEQKNPISKRSTRCDSHFRNPAVFNILKEPLIVQKQTIPQQKALDLSFNLAPWKWAWHYQEAATPSRRENEFGWEFNDKSDFLLWAVLQSELSAYSNNSKANYWLRGF